MAYIFWRILAVVPVMGFVALFVFLLLRLAPGDPAAIVAGDAATPEQLERIRTALGLDRPLMVQFGVWIGRLLQGDLGVSIISGLPVTRMIAQRLEPTIALALLTMVFTVLVAVPLGALAAWTHKSWADRAITGFCAVGFSVPVFVIGYVLILAFAVALGWLPVQGYRLLAAGPGPFLRHLALPVLTLSLPLIGLIARMARAAMLDVLGEDHVRTARAKGLRERAVLARHVLRNAALPIMTVIGNCFALLISGVVVTESVFNLPGIGRLTVDAVLARDYPVIQGVILLAAAFCVALNLLIDLLYAALDPRIRYR